MPKIAKSKTTSAKALGAGWQVARTGKGATVAFSTQKEAVKAAKVMAKSMAIGRAGMMKINALEGIVTSKDTKARLAEFDRRGLSPAERRAEIVKAYSRKG